ncbi:MAG: class I SAM-dependent methyltransferase [Eubacterium sp.]
MQKLSERLLAVASLVKKGAVIADVGTDHGFLPVYLIENGIVDEAVALDVNEGPLSSCKALVEKENLQNKIKVRLSDGLDNLCPDECDTVIIAGMGGELIADILSRHKWIKNKHLILQPMTHSEITRRFLFDSGFEINDDIIVKDGRHYYSVMGACYTGEVKRKSRADYYLGNIKDFSQKEYFIHLKNYLYNKSKSGEDLSDVLQALEEKI